MLDEECLIPKGTDAEYVKKMNNAFESNRLYNEPSLRKGTLIQGIPAADNPNTKLSFCITHYAGEVMYTATGWLEKNRGALHTDLIGMLQVSEDKVLTKLFTEWRQKSPSVSFVYRASLRALSDTMAKTKQHYIRCLKPNFEKKADLFNGDVISRQLRYTGCSAVVEIQRSGYPVSFSHADFVRQYRCIAFEQPALIDATLGNTTIARNILEYVQKEHSTAKLEEAWLTSLKVQVGRTKVFMRDEVLRMLELPRTSVLGRAALCVQRYGRTYLVARAVSSVRFHFVAVAAIKKAIEDKNVQMASAKMAELKEKWKTINAGSGASSVIQSIAERLVELEEEVDELKYFDKIEFENGERYEGAWRGDTMNGKGTYYYASGNVYRGQWKDGNREGVGEHTWAEGFKYTGQWANNTMHGTGKYVFPAGSEYDGEYVNGVRTGQGTYKHANGSVYKGSFLSGKKHGHGEHFDASGKLVYEGQFAADKEHGEGRFILGNGAVYEGQFENGKKTGRAKFTDPSGVVYEGDFVDGQREGYGKYINPDGSVAHDGQWKANHPVTDVS